MKVYFLFIVCSLNSRSCFRLMRTFSHSNPFSLPEEEGCCENLIRTVLFYKTALCAYCQGQRRMGTFHAFVGTFSEAGVGSEGSMWCTITSIVVMFS